MQNVEGDRKKSTNAATAAQSKVAPKEEIAGR